MATIEIRPERPEDVDAVRAVTTAAFASARHSSGTEAAIVDALRSAGALTISLVAIEHDRIVGHVAFSPVTIDGNSRDWFGLGPVSVLPDCQRSGTGGALIRQGLFRLRKSGAQGCVVLGNPTYYRRFGFESGTGLVLPGMPAEYFMRLVFPGAPEARGSVRYHPVFGMA